VDEKLERIAEWCVGLEISGTAVKTAEEARKIHIADSLAGLELPVVRAAGRIVDIGSGAGFPGLVLAVSLPRAEIVLVDSVRKKMEAAAALARELELPNVECVWGRVEEIAEVGSPHRGSYDVVTARALAQLGVLLEYAAPLLKTGGELVSWKGAPSDEELTAAQAAAAQLGMSELTQLEATPFTGSRRRHFFTASKIAQTPERFPRRPGIALKRPLC
jgi:16S rRNA (guanine527-N7)-methyltransferase